MGSGESDVRYIGVANTPTYNSAYDVIGNNTSTVNSFYYDYHIYLYQVKCPKRSCKTNNWLQLNVITPCRKCGARLKAVNEQADFEVPVDQN